MNSTSTFSSVVTPIKALWRWLMVEPGCPTITRHSRAQSPQFAAGLAQPEALGDSTKRQIASGKLAVRRMPVRVVQVLEAGQTHAQAGRLRISGRMADVCAELDRLAACEALLH